MEERATQLQTFSTRAAARILAISPDRIRYWVRRRLLKPALTRGRRFQFAFHDLLVMRLTKDLIPTRHHLRPVRRCFERLGQMLDPRRPVTSLKVLDEDGRIVVRDGGVKFEADSGQLMLNFDVARSARRVAAGAEPDKVRGMLEGAEALAPSDPGRAIRLLTMIVKSEPGHLQARLRLGALLQERADSSGALRQFLNAAAIAPDRADVHLKLGELYRALDDPQRALRSFERALALGADSLEAHRNLAELYEAAGRKRDALRHLSALHRLSRED